MNHHIATVPGQKVCNPHQPLPKKMWEAVRKELEVILDMA